MEGLYERQITEPAACGPPSALHTTARHGSISRHGSGMNKRPRHPVRQRKGDNGRRSMKACWDVHTYVCVCVCACVCVCVGLETEAGRVAKHNRRTCVTLITVSCTLWYPVESVELAKNVELSDSTYGLRRLRTLEQLQLCESKPNSQSKTPYDVAKDSHIQCF